MNLQRTQSYQQLLASTLREKPDSCIIQELISHYPHPAHLIDATEQELRSNIKGIGISKAKQIVAAVQLVREFATPLPEPTPIRSPQDVHDLLAVELAYESKEQFVCLFLNTKNRVIAKEVIFVGTINACLVHPREIFRAAIRKNSAAIICCHNHPSGDPTPSPEDIETTKRLVQVGELTGIELLDHIIIGGHRYISLREKGFMEPDSANKLLVH